MKPRYMLPMILGTVAFLAAPVSQAAESDQNLLRRIEAMEQQLKTLKVELDKTRKTAKSAKTKADRASKQASMGDNALSKFKLTGYAQTGFKATDSGTVDTTFTGAQFNPIVLYRYNESLMFEGEVEFEVEDGGGTDVKLEYATINYMAHDAVTLVAGKFLNPLGQFQERLHPKWINKLTDRPAGGFRRQGRRASVERWWPHGPRRIFSRSRPGQLCRLCQQWAATRTYQRRAQLRQPGSLRR
ncbi:MAG: hypothetical protein HQ514_04310 [Rhodospirillales bacterium]|nr:hypothetical protein [Rhodospirillales bacterium]